MSTTAPDGAHRAGEVLAVGFGTTVAMWFTGYVSRLPEVALPPAVVGPLLLSLLVAGGAVAGRLGTRGWRGGLRAGALTSVLNLLVLGSLLAGADPNRLTPSAAFWLPGSLVLGAALGALGGAVGARGRREGRGELNWTGAFASVAASATLALLAIGGLVTGHGAGLAVADWPNSFGYNMFLYPLSRMTGGIYFEHAHRLFGSLVGLTTVVLAVHLWRVDRRRWMRGLAAAAVVMVSAQGLLGGLRVTGRLTLSTDAAVLAPSTPLALVHGVLGQLFFATLIGIAVLTSRAWADGRRSREHPDAHTERLLAAGLVVAVVAQLLLGALQRHLARGLVVHITMAGVVAVLALVVGSRLWGLYPEMRPLPAWGKALLGVVSVQLLLGLAALVAVGGLDASAPRAGWRALVTTLHQTTGAVLLGMSVASGLLVCRRLRPGGETSAASGS